SLHPQSSRRHCAFVQVPITRWISPTTRYTIGHCHTCRLPRWPTWRDIPCRRLPPAPLHSMHCSSASATSRWACTGCTSACTSMGACHWRSEEHTSELQSRENLVCRLLLEKKKKLERGVDDEFITYES